MIEVQYLKTFFMNFNKILHAMWNAYFSCSKQTFYIIRMPISYSSYRTVNIFKYTSLYYFFMATKVNRSTKSEQNLAHLMRIAIETPEKLPDDIVESVVDFWNRKPRRIAI